MQRTNILLFIVLSAAILGGWYLIVRSTSDPADDQAQADKKAKGPSDEEKAKAAKEKAEKERIAKEKADLERIANEKVKGAEQPAPIGGPAKSETLGGPGFHLTVVTTQRGAGVRSVTLNRFDTADWRGRPKLDDKGKPVPLELIQDDEFAPSYRMYHYLEPKDKNPIFGLGEENWKLDSRSPPGAAIHEVRYSTKVPDLDHIKILKTYRLGPQDYHVTLILEIHDLREDRNLKAIPFRYQLTGAQGLPIEGEWYSENGTCRNAFIGLVDPRNRLWRKLEDSRSISVKRGGETWPENQYSRGDTRMQYAGVANQYFCAMILVDDTQPDRDNILAWARPTQETHERAGEIKFIGNDFIIFRDHDSLVARDKLYKIIEDQKKTREDTREGINEKLLPAQKDLLKKVVDVRKMWLPHPTKVDANLEKAKESLEQALEHLDASRTADAAAEQEKAIEKLTQARAALVEPGRYTLLPRAKRHLEDLELKVDDVAVLSTYDTPEGQAIATWFRGGQTLKPQFDDITVRVHSEAIDLAPTNKVKHQFLLYHGPVKAAQLAQFTGDKTVPDDLVTRYAETNHLRTLTDYPYDNWFGRVSSWIMLTDLIILVTRFMHWLLNLLHYVFGYGLSIVVLTVIVRGAMFPISRKQALFSAKMQELGPELKKVQEKYKDDPTGKMQATQEFYRKHGINPLGSCWPIFLQMPIFLGLYFAFQESVHFRLADFLWIKNLSAPDMLFYWSESIPLLSTPDHAGGILGALYLGPYFNILPAIAAVFMLFQQMQMMPPATDDQTAAQQKILKWMPILFAIMFYKVAAGLCIYFIASSVWGLAERKLLPKKKTSPGVPDSTGASGPGPSGGKGPSDNGKPSPKTPLIPKGKWAKKDKDKDKPKEPVTAFDKLKALWREILKQAEKK